MDTIVVNGTTINLVADSVVTINDWIIQVSPSDHKFFQSLNGDHAFVLNTEESSDTITGYVLKSELHKFNRGIPQVQVQIRRQGW